MNARLLAYVTPLIVGVLLTVAGDPAHAALVGGAHAEPPRSSGCEYDDPSVSTTPSTITGNDAENARSTPRKSSGGVLLVSGAGSATKAGRAADDILPTPSVSDTRLQNIVNDLYKGTTNPERVGNGTTMDAIRHELATGGAVHGRRHLEKGRQYSNGLRNFLRRNPDASLHDRRVAQSLDDELQGAMAGR